MLEKISIYFYYNLKGGINMKIKVSFNNPSLSDNGKFQGWGTSLCWWANRIGYSETLTQKAAELFFSPNGLNLNIMRYNIGGGDDPAHKHIKRTDSMVPGWLDYNPETKEATYCYNNDANQLNVLKACYKANENAYVEVFSNSPPYFMTISGCSSGGKDPNKNNLRDDCYEAFAEYVGAVTEYINNTLNIKVSAVSPMNEPNTDFWQYQSEKQEGCHFDAGDPQNRVLIATYEAIKRRNLPDVELVCSDETATDKAITAYKAYSPEVKGILKRISTHTYSTSYARKLGKLMQAEDKNLWMTETDWGSTAGIGAGEMGAGLWIAKKIIYDINTLSPSAWVLWQVIDSHKSKDGYCGNKDSGIPDTTKGFWGLAFADHDTSEILLTQKYYCMGQFSRYINVNDTIYHVNDSVLCAANEKQVKLVLVNDTKRTKNIEIDLSETGRHFSTVKLIRTSGTIADGEHWTELPQEAITNNAYIAKLKSHSVTTMIFE